MEIPYYILVFGIIALFGGIFLYFDLTSQVSKLDDQNTALNQTIENEHNTIAELQTNLANKNQQMTVLNSTKIQLESQISTKELELSMLEIAKATLENAIISKDTEITNKQNEIANKNTKITTLEYNITTKAQELTTLKAEKTILESAITSKNVEITTKTQQLNELAAKMDVWETKIKTQLNWFGTNANIANIPEYASIRTDLQTYCTKTENNTCYILLSCLPFINKEHGMAYRYDRGDNIQSLEKTFANDGGDCEDWAILVDAEITFLENQCNIPTIQYETYASNNSIDAFHNITYTQWKNYSTGWGYESYTTVIVPRTHNYHYAVCGVGHCLIGFLNANIAKSTDIKLATQQTLVESQTGEKLDYPFSSSPNFTSNDINGIFTDMDYYINHGTWYNENWQGFKDYLAELKVMQG